MVIATTTWDAGDVIETFIGHYRRLGVDQILVIDYGSEDGTRAHLAANADLVTVLDLTSLTDDTSNDLLALAQQRFPGGWCLFCDPDELLVTRHADIKGLVARSAAPALLIPEKNMTAPRSLAARTMEQSLGIRDLTLRIDGAHQRTPEERSGGELLSPWIYTALPPKVLVRLQAAVEIGAGDHTADVAWGSPRRVPASDACLLHYPFRSYARFEHKVGQATKHFAVNPPEGGSAWQYRRWMRCHEQGELRQEYLAQFAEDSELPDLLRRGVLAADDRPYQWARAAEQPASPGGNLAPRRPAPTAPAPKARTVIAAEALRSTDQIAADVPSALKRAEGFALVRVGPRQTRLLHDAAWELPEHAPPFAPTAGEPSAAELERAVRDAGCVVVPTRRDRALAAPLLEEVFHHRDLRLRAMTDSATIYALFGIDAASGERIASAPLLDAVRGMSVAVVGPQAAVAQRLGPELGLDVVGAIESDRHDAAGPIVDAIAGMSADIDVVLCAGGMADAVICSAAARDHGLVAIDAGHPLEWLLRVRHDPGSARALATQWAVEQYRIEASEPPEDEPHPWEGQLVQAKGQARVHLVERGRKRVLRTGALLTLFEGSPVRVSAEEIDALPDGLPVGAVFDRRDGLVVLLGGEARKVQLGMPLLTPDEVDATDLPQGAEVTWTPPSKRGATT